MQHAIKLFFFLLLFNLLLKDSRLYAQLPTSNLVSYNPNHPFIKYTGRVDFSNPILPRFWQPGVYLQFSFKGSYCEVIINDEMLWGKNHNYLQVVVDGVSKRIQTKTKRDTIVVAQNLAEGLHTVLICKNTEANIGYIEVAGIRCKQLVKQKLKVKRKIEFIGNSITCGTGSDISLVPCGKGVWQDQHNAYAAYGPTVARLLNASWHLSSVSGIGLMHSCCNLDITMPQVFDKIDMRNNIGQWNFQNYQPNVVTVCLGQNDGVQDSTLYCNTYLSFINNLRKNYPSAKILLISSPMASGDLKAFMQKTIAAIKNKCEKDGDKKVYYYIFKKQYIGGCDSHPNLAEHVQIANELLPEIKKITKW